MKQPDKELKPCPFCGGNPSTEIHPMQRGELLYILCRKCGIGTSRAPSAFDHALVKTTWNTRPISDSSEEMLNGENFETFWQRVSILSFELNGIMPDKNSTKIAWENKRQWKMSMEKARNREAGYAAGHEDGWNECKSSMENELKAALLEVERLKEVEKLYYELIYGVARKWPDETRHQTALKYILQAETPTSQCASTQSESTKGVERWFCKKCGRENNPLNSTCDSGNPITGFCDGELTNESTKGDVK